MEVPVPSELFPNLIFQDSYYSSSGDMLFIRRVRVTLRLSLLQLLVSVRWNGFGLSQELRTILLIAAGAWIVLWLIRKLNNPFLALSVAWAFYGIILKRQSDYPMIMYVAGAALGLVAGTFVFRLITARKAGG